MSSTTVAPPDGASAALELMDAATELLLSAEFWQMPGQVQADALAKAERITRRLEYGKLLLLADFHSRDIAGKRAGISTRQFLRSRLRISSSEASRRVHAVRELTPATDALVNLSEQALNRGDLPTVAGEKPHVTVTINLDDLRDASGHGILNTGTAISPQTARTALRQPPLADPPRRLENYLPTRDSTRHPTTTHRPATKTTTQRYARPARWLT